MPDINDDRHLNAIARATQGDEEEYCPYTGIQMARGEHLTSYSRLKEGSIFDIMEDIRKRTQEILNAK